MSWASVAVTGVGGTAAVFSLIYLLRRFLINGKDDLKVPGLTPSSKEEGNLTDIGKAGSLHEFLTNLHKEFGPIASFWWGTQHSVSIASPELFKQHQDIFDRATELFRMFEPFITKDSIEYANGKDGRGRREAFDKVFNYDCLKMYYEGLQKVADDITTEKLEKADPQDHLPLGELMFLFSVKASLTSLMGDKFKDDNQALAFRRNYEVAWGDMEKRLTEPGPIDETRQRNFDQAMAALRKIVGHAVKEREAHGDQARDFILLDAIIAHHDDEDKRFADAITYTTGGVHTTGNLLTWCFYYLCKHEDVEEKLYQEIVSVLGPDGKVTPQNITKMKYLRYVLDESLRRGIVGPYAARICDHEIELGGFKIPPNVPVVHALGVSLMDDKVWKDPNRFDPDRFSPEGSHGRPTIAFSPYGFAGRRQCPGYRFAYVEASILLVTALQKVKFTLVPGQDIRRQYGFVTHPNTDVWVKVEHRK